MPDDNPNRGVSKVALLRFSNEYIVKLHDKVGKRDSYTDKLRDEVRRLRGGRGQEVRGEEGEDLLDMDMLAGEEDDFGEADAHGERVEEEEDADMEEDEGDEEEDEEEGVARGMGVMPRRAGAGQKVGSSGVTVAAGPKSGRRARD